MFCENCGNKLDADALFCTSCGVKISENPTKKFCSHCGNVLEEDAVFCMMCGNRIHGESNEASLKKEPVKVFTDNSEKSMTHEAHIETVKNTENASQESQENMNKSIDVSDESLNGKSEPVLEYKDTYINGRHFLYLDDSKKVFCPKCKKRVDSTSTLCSWCNTSFMTATIKNNDILKDSNGFRSVTERNFEEKKLYSESNVADTYANFLLPFGGM